MPRPNARVRSRAAGAAAVEFALVLPLLLLLVLGGIDWGWYFFTEQVVVNAAREGARAGSLETTDDGIAQADAYAHARDYVGRGGLDAAKAVVNVAVTAESVTVDVSYPSGSITGFTRIALPKAARASAQMRR